METGLAGWMGSLTNGSDESGGQNSNLTNNAWVTWDMMSLKLGKRHYSSEEAVIPDSHVTTISSSTAKRGKPPYPYHVTHATTTTTQWPTVSVTSSRRCQVEGCNVALGKAKEYYKRHKVCEIHSKAPKVVVLGLLKRFCQQCSRFHDITEFDEAKRSCRRRLKGHNLRRRKGGALSDSLPPNFPRPHENNSMMKQRLRPLPPSPSPSPPSKPAHALSLLSSPKTEYSISTGDLSYRCSAALYELIAANRSSTSVARNFLNQNNPHQKIGDVNKHTSHDTQMLDQSSHTTSSLDMKQATALDFGLLSMKEKSKDPEEWTDYCWSAFGGSNVV